MHFRSSFPWTFSSLEFQLTLEHHIVYILYYINISFNVKIRKAHIVNNDQVKLRRFYSLLRCFFAASLTTNDKKTCSFASFRMRYRSKDTVSSASGISNGSPMDPYGSSLKFPMFNVILRYFARGVGLGYSS